MNKLALLVSVLLLSIPATYGVSNREGEIPWGYEWLVTNNTSGRVRVNVHMVARGPTSGTLEAGETGSFKTGGWCSDAIEAQALDGNASGLHCYFKYGMQCRGRNAFLNYREQTPDINVQGSAVGAIGGLIPDRILEIYVSGVGTYDSLKERKGIPA